MQSDMIMITGEKESFLIRVLVKKMQEAGIKCKFVPWNINDINAAWEGTSLVTLYMESGFVMSGDTLHFLRDKMHEDGVRMIAIGEDNDIHEILDRVPGELIHKTFVRPINNEEYIRTVTELYNKMQSGEFRKTVLIVDDDPNYLGLVREWLKDKYKVAMANSGLQAIKWLGKNKADLILLDYEMPVTTGPQVLEMLRSDSETRDIPVMFLTGKGDKESVMAVLALKPEGYFLKTIGREELLEKLEKFFVLRKQPV